MNFSRLCLVAFSVLAFATPVAASSEFRHRVLDVEGLKIHVVDAGSPAHDPVLFLHGFPEDWSQFEEIMRLLKDEAHVVAIDLPGIGRSTTPAPSNEKHVLARHVNGVIRALGLKRVTLVGHDIGGDIAYAYLHAYPNELRAAVIMDVGIPGVEPWSTLQQSPVLWFWHFHAIPQLPEQLIQGREAVYFRWFLKNVSANPGWVTDAVVTRYAKAYSRPTALRTAFDWFRAYAADARHNQRPAGMAIQTPVLYLGGEHSAGRLRDAFAHGLRERGLANVEVKVVPNAGHYVTGEQPERCATEIREFLRKTQPARERRT